GKRPSAALPSSLVPPGRRPSGPEALRRTSLYASFLGISEALHMDIFHQPLRKRFFAVLVIGFLFAEIGCFDHPGCRRE
ncbi:MAG: hypothetical protein PVH82_17880, partial [Desulfobacteraceae bacterium]